MKNVRDPRVYRPHTICRFLSLARIRGVRMFTSAQSAPAGIPAEEIQFQDFQRSKHTCAVKICAFRTYTIRAEFEQHFNKESMTVHASTMQYRDALYALH
eukprot:TRINITY_DN17854_c0_g1::TRINITY_DN17854_c0_g1_i1::g.11780::m.11780 TRINITY_DN17854_c0_g1::TRINITY_DN17854_c0_g1_i1::g.11780  ORF type:complete len:100 (+),score=-6.68,DUF3449/PF11931.3/0.0064,ADAM_spacer1/PF05986.9/0.15 TRINITY_DN17854_c0_g1_i1:2-301(+)